MIFISDEAKKFGGGIQHFCMKEKFGYFTFYGGKYINLVKYKHSTEKLCKLCHQHPFLGAVSVGPRVKIQNCDIHQ